MALQGSGTSDNPYQIMNINDLNEYLTKYKTAECKFGANIESRGSLPLFDVYHGVIDLGGFTLRITNPSEHGLGHAGRRPVTFKGGVIEILNAQAVPGAWGGWVRYQLSFYEGLYIHDCLIRVELKGASDLPFLMANNRPQFPSNCVIQFLNGSETKASSVNCQSGTLIVINDNGVFSGATEKRNLKTEMLPDWMKNKGWVVKLGEIYPSFDYATFITGYTLLDAEPIPNRRIEARPFEKGTYKGLFYYSNSNDVGYFLLSTGFCNTPLLVLAYDQCDKMLSNNASYIKTEVCLPNEQNGYKYQCITAGTTGTLPNPLPTSGLLQSGTAEFSIEPLIPPVCYGPVIPKQIT